MKKSQIKKDLQAEPNANPQALKHLISQSIVRRMAQAIEEVYPKFDQTSFIQAAKKLEPLEMKPRVQLIREELRKHLPQDYSQALQILINSLRKNTLDSFDLWPYSDYIQTYGLDHLKLSLDALKKLTPLFTSEFAVRPFLKRYPNETLEYLRVCAQDDQVDIRRWASEGTRPRLPWGERLNLFIEDPSLTFEILEILKFDPELYVRKSVANHLNDIAKDHPMQVIHLLSQWKESTAPEHVAKVDWIIQKALRTLIKAGDPGALKLIGVSSQPKIKFKDFKLNKKQYKMNERIEFNFKIQSASSRSQKLVVDYIIHFAKANQKMSSKVFKLRTFLLPAKAELTVIKTHSLKQVTTRKHYSGVHYLEIQINGRVLGRRLWHLIGA